MTHFGKRKRIRGRRLQAYREQYFRMHPLCAECDRNGVIRLATQLDHIVASAWRWRVLVEQDS